PGTVVALDDVTLDVPEGALAGVIGPNGAGKSTLARCVYLSERPDRGTVQLGCTNLTTLGASQLRPARRHIGVVPPAHVLRTQPPGVGNISLRLEQAGVDGPQRRSKVAALPVLSGLTEKAAHHPDQVTPGQRQRIGVARALATGPSVLVADDPTADL